ncbi:hypothetical protein AQI88_39570 [Streptomyces cellostaticus]|uniref:Uncharacterized protein n=1 Tax=Streptomyces cellostaticus TaxID=67285 RepID=A0A101NAX7_9ACTN|nr:hypothetical protein [Streptomyces cellostaticus]KUM89761.1 hypothetical protein AQI88_39570 [Streptomyces cellostaticus]GHI10205.1 hypothetical protein Scel_85260 [Streptomyces cellostaticus]
MPLERAAQHLADRSHLFGLSEDFWACQVVRGLIVSVFDECAHGHRSDVCLMEEGHRHGAVDSLHHVTGSDLVGPPQRVGGERARAKVRPGEPGLLDELFHARVGPAHRMVLLLGGKSVLDGTG